MGAAERRNAIMRVLHNRRFEKITNLATEFGVSERTIRRDIETLSLSEPIYTQCGRYGGGVYVVEGYTANKIALTKQECLVLKKICMNSEKELSIILTNEDVYILNNMLEKYSFLEK